MTGYSTFFRVQELKFPHQGIEWAHSKPHRLLIQVLPKFPAFVKQISVFYLFYLFFFFCDFAKFNQTSRYASIFGVVLKVFISANIMIYKYHWLFQLH